jgi:hypothetical protein
VPAAKASTGVPAIHHALLMAKPTLAAEPVTAVNS